MKIRISTCSGHLLFEAEALHLLAIAFYGGRMPPGGLGMPAAGAVLVAEVVTDAPGACVRIADDKDGRALQLREFFTVPAPCADG